MHSESKHNDLHSSRRIAYRFALCMSMLFIVCLLLYCVIYAPKPNQTYANIVTEYPAAIAGQIDVDKYTPGYYEYETEDTRYVLLTFGEIQGYVIQATPTVDDVSVYFDIDAIEVSDVRTDCKYVVYATNAQSIGADENALKNPTYGVGSIGMNIGWVEANENGEYYITPFLDTTPIDRIFKTSGDASFKTGLYYYEYEVLSSGAVATTSKPMDEYTLFVTVDAIDFENQLASLSVGDEKVRVTAVTSLLSEDDIMTLASLCDIEDNTVQLTLANHDGVLTIASLGTALDDTASADATIVDESQNNGEELDIEF